MTELRKEENLVTTNVLDVMRMEERNERRETFVLERGAYDAPTEKVLPGIPSFISNGNETKVTDRLKLAKWLVSESNPLTARIIVNRFWAMLFGKGIVATPDDFGSQGDLPSHPELLDWMAVDFMEKGWDVKAFLKSILMSATYQQSSIGDKKANEIDPTNEWYARFPAHRLSAEIIRDNALAASGLLVKKIGGKSVYPYQPKGIWKALATNETEYKQGTGEDLYRRSMYTIWKRSSPPPSMMNFDAPDRFYCMVNRQKTSTPLQALVLMNDPQYVEAAKALGELSLKKGGNSIPERLDFMYKSLVGRAPSSVEKEALENLYKEERESLSNEKERAKNLLGIGEYVVEESLDEVEAATHMLLASAIMNYDEFVMKR